MAEMKEQPALTRLPGRDPDRKCPAAGTKHICNRFLMRFGGTRWGGNYRTRDWHRQTQVSIHRILWPIEGLLVLHL